MKILQVLKAYLKNKSEDKITWLIHQKCSDMFMYSKWNGSKTYGFGNNERDFGTDYGICCWYTPQLNFSAIPDGPDTDWAYWFNSVPKGAKTGKDNGFREGEMISPKQICTLLSPIQIWKKPIQKRLRVLLRLCDGE